MHKEEGRQTDDLERWRGGPPGGAAAAGTSRTRLLARAAAIATQLSVPEERAWGGPGGAGQAAQTDLVGRALAGGQPRGSTVLCAPD